MSSCDSAQMTGSVLLGGGGEIIAPPIRIRVHAPLLQSQRRQLLTWEQGRDDFRPFIFLLLCPPPLVFSCLCLRTLTHLFSVLANLASSSLLPSFLLYPRPATQPDPELSHRSVAPIHADAQGAALFLAFSLCLQWSVWFRW